MSSLLQEIGGEHGGAYTSLCAKVYGFFFGFFLILKVEECVCIIVKEKKIEK